MTTYLRGDVVEVRSWEEIGATLDQTGALEGLPFMPEMRRFCGRRFRVARHADRTCVEGVGERYMTNAIFLEEVRCDGAAHDGCQRNCLIFWKEAWLRPVDPGASVADRPEAGEPALPQFPVKVGGRYYCQSTELARATYVPSSRPIATIISLSRDLFRNEVGPVRLTRILALAVVNQIRKLAGLAWLSGPGTERSKGDLCLRSGDLVEIRPLAEIIATLDQRGRNKGLTFDPEMTTYKGIYEVDTPVERIILETTGKMRTLTHTVTLKGLTCQGLCGKNCPRANPIYWREIWLRRVPQRSSPTLQQAAE